MAGARTASASGESLDDASPILSGIKADCDVRRHAASEFSSAPAAVQSRRLDKIYSFANQFEFGG